MTTDDVQQQFEACPGCGAPEVSGGMRLNDCHYRFTCGAKYRSRLAIKEGDADTGCRITVPVHGLKRCTHGNPIGSGCIDCAAHMKALAEHGEPS